MERQDYNLDIGMKSVNLSAKTSSKFLTGDSHNRLGAIRQSLPAAIGGLERKLLVKPSAFLGHDSTSPYTINVL